MGHGQACSQTDRRERDSATARIPRPDPQDPSRHGRSSYSHLWKVEHAKVSVGLDLLGEIADALDVPVCDLVAPPRHQRGQTYVITTHNM